MELIRIMLVNSKGIKGFHFDPDTESAQIFRAKERSGIYDAFLWLLFDKMSENQKSASLKKVNKDSIIIHEMEYEVEAVFGTNEKQVTFRKVCCKELIQKRGSVFRKFNRYTTDYFIDGVPVNKNKYITGISFLADEKTFRLFTPPPNNKQACVILNQLQTVRIQGNQIKV
jgi:hypothetical protein